MLPVATFALATACSDDTTKDEPTPPEREELVLSVDKESLVIDTDAVATFTVMYGTEDVTATAEIRNTADNTPLAGNTFTATAEGDYTFEASYEGVKSNTVSITAELEPAPEPDEPFAIELYDLYATGVTMRVTPLDNERGYYFDVLDEENYAYYDANGWQELISYTLQGIMNDYQMSAQEAVDAITSLGPDEWTFQNLEHNTRYYAVVLGLETSGAITADFVAEEFCTPDVAMSENTFEITVSNASRNGADYTVVPSMKDEAYFTTIVSRAVADEFATDSEIADYCLSLVPVVGDMLRTGDYNHRNDGFCQPGRDFYVVAFGYDSGVVTTPVAKAEFSTTTDGDPASCTFGFEIGTVTHDTAEVAVTPSNQFNVFFWEAISREDLEFFQWLYEAEEGITDLQEVMAMYWRTEVLELVCDESGMTPAQFVDMAALWGDAVGGTDATTLTFLDEESEYLLWAVCLDAYGNPVGDFHFSEPFTTDKEVISPAMAEIKVVGYFNGDELTGEWHMENQAVVVMEITPNDDAVEWYSDFYAGDVSFSERYNLIKNLTTYSGVYMPTMLIRTTPWEQFCSAASVAKDADGNFGEVSVEVLLCTKSEARPAAEFEQYANAPMPLAAASKALLQRRTKPEVKLHRKIATQR